MAGDGLGVWREFFTKIRLHDNDLSPMRVGFKSFFLMAYHSPFDQWGPFEAQKLKAFEAYAWAWWVIQAVVLAVYASRNGEAGREDRTCWPCEAPHGVQGLIFPVRRFYGPANLCYSPRLGSSPGIATK